MLCVSVFVELCKPISQLSYALLVSLYRYLSLRLAAALTRRLIRGDLPTRITTVSQHRQMILNIFLKLQARRWGYRYTTHR